MEAALEIIGPSTLMNVSIVHFLIIYIKSYNFYWKWDCRVAFPRSYLFMFFLQSPLQLLYYESYPIADSRICMTQYQNNNKLNVFYQ